MKKFSLVMVLSISFLGVLSHFEQALGFDTTVYLLQEKLHQEGIDPGPLDGFTGKMTRSAIRRFQKANDLPVTGRMGTALLAKLGLNEIRTFVLLQGQNFAEPKTKSDITIKTVEGGLIRVSGYIEFGMAHGEQQKLVWNNGATHHIEGPVQFGGGFKGYIFEGDLVDPLTFRVISWIGYVYVGGKGKVIKRSTKEIIKLGH